MLKRHATRAMAGNNGMDDPRLTRKRRLLGFCFLAVFVPLLVLLAFQYRWLLDLERASMVERKVALANYLGTIAKEVHLFYLGTAERTLNLPATVFEPQRIQKVAKHFRSRGTEAASRLFVVSYLAEGNWPKMYLYDPVSQTMVVPEDASPELSAIKMAVVPWGYLAKRGGVIDEAAFAVEEKDPAHRTILNPITDESSQLVGLAGMIVDQAHFRDVVLPRAINDSLPASTNDVDLRVTVRDATGQVVLGEAFNVRAEGVSNRWFSFLFSDWQIALRDPHSTPKQWARANFAANVTLSLVTGVLLLGGILLVLRTTAREMRLSEMKNQFVSNVSHELRTPLASIRVFGELLCHGRVSSPEKIRQYGETIETESRRLTALINNILDFSKIESGLKVYELAPIDLEEVVRGVLETFEVRLRHRGFAIDFRAPAAPLPKVRADRAAIRQVIANLVDNAVKYSGDSRKIAVGLARDDDRVVVTVEDHGIGISRDEQAKIFERFHRVGSGLVHEVRGSGLGLSIVEHVVRTHGGEVRVESEIGRGSTFSIRLPIETTESSIDSAEQNAAPDELELRMQQSG